MAAVGEDHRNGELWVVAECRSPGAAESLFDDLRERGWRTLGRRSPPSLWLDREATDWPAALDVLIAVLAKAVSYSLPMPHLEPLSRIYMQELSSIASVDGSSEDHFSLA